MSSISVFYMTYLFFQCFLILAHIEASSPFTCQFSFHSKLWHYCLCTCWLYHKLNISVYQSCCVQSGTKSAAHRRVGMLQIVFWLSGEYMHLKFEQSFGKSGFGSHFEIVPPSRQGSRDQECWALHWCLVTVFGVHNFESLCLPTLYGKHWNNHKINPGFEVMYHHSGNTMHFSFFTIRFFPPTQKITIPKKVSVSQTVE